MTRYNIRMPAEKSKELLAKGRTSVRYNLRGPSYFFDIHIHLGQESRVSSSFPDRVSLTLSEEDVRKQRPIHIDTPVEDVYDFSFATQGS